MSQIPNLDERYEAALPALKQRGQQHVLTWWGELDDPQKDRLLGDIESVNWALVDRLLESHVKNRPASNIPRDLQPPPVFRRSPRSGEEAMYHNAEQIGVDALRAGKVAAFTVAGGQGTRLGHDGPKGTLVVTPAGDRTLFQLFADMIRAARRKYGAAVPWYVMTSPANHRQTVEYFEHNNFLGLPRGDVMLFPQGTMPTFDLNGRMLLAAKDRLALAPDGHGGSLRALASSGALADMRRRGVETISYFQVDNPLVKPFDPLFVGLHLHTGSEMSTKVTPKADDLERVGNVCLADGKVQVIEYSEFPESLARRRNPDGDRRFDAANLAIHLIDVAFVERIVGESFELPFRRAEKVVAFVDQSGSLVHPDRPNAVKLETFVFDALPLANQPLVFQTDRAEEFAPVKNATGVDSLDTSRRAQIAQACRWLEAAGRRVPRRPDGEPDVTVAISPLLALDAADLRDHLDAVPDLTPSTAVYLE